MSEKKENLKTPEKPVVDEKVEPLKIKKRPRNLGKKDEPIKIDLNKKKDNAVQESSAKEEVLQSTSQEQETGKESEVELQVVGQTHEEEKPSEEVKVENVIEEITSTTENFKPKENVEEQEQENKTNLPENIQNLVNFMSETGGNIEDYVRLNADYTSVDDDALLKEYYKKTKPHLSNEDVNFLLEEKYSYDEEYEEEKEIRKKRLAKMEEVADARNFLEQMKKDYYREIKSRPGVTQEQQKAMDFFNRYNEEQEMANKRHQVFEKNTNDFFSNDFKGFDFDLGEKKFRYGVKNPTDVATAQSDIATFIKKFLNEDGSVKDYTGYHKAIYAARNADTIAKHFYDQGVADATKDIITKSKNISNDVRQAPPSDSISFNGLTIKSVSGVDSSKLKIKRKR
tara:strand:- start:30234 stop:31427 length:1194 start_codon:yes stop_codon:yes gene_type:complete